MFAQAHIVIEIGAFPFINCPPNRCFKAAAWSYNNKIILYIQNRHILDRKTPNQTNFKPDNQMVKPRKQMLGKIIER